MCYCLDLRSGSKLASFLANKCISIAVAALQLFSVKENIVRKPVYVWRCNSMAYIFWVLALFAFIIRPGPVKEQIQELPSVAIAFVVILALTAIGCSALLMVGLLKNNRTYIQAFIILIIVIIVLLILTVIINIFTQPRRFGLSGFLSNTLVILVDILSYFVVRNYYLATAPKGSNQNRNVV